MLSDTPQSGSFLARSNDQVALDHIAPADGQHLTQAAELPIVADKSEGLDYV